VSWWAASEEELAFNPSQSPSKTTFQAVIHWPDSSVAETEALEALYADHIRMESWKSSSPTIQKHWQNESLAYAKFSSKPPFKKPSKIPQRFRDRASSAALSRIIPAQDGVNLWQVVDAPDPSPTPTISQSSGPGQSTGPCLRPGVQDTFGWQP
jgi:hypothetical protein